MTRLGEKQDHCQKTLEGSAKTVDERVAQLHGNGGGRSGEFRLVLFGKFQVDSGKVDAVLQSLLLGFHLLDFASNARGFLFHFEDFLNRPAALSKHSIKAGLRVARILPPREPIYVLLSNFFTRLASLSALPELPRPR